MIALRKTTLTVNIGSVHHSSSSCLAVSYVTIIVHQPVTRTWYNNVAYAKLFTLFTQRDIFGE